MSGDALLDPHHCRRSKNGRQLQSICRCRLLMNRQVKQSQTVSAQCCVGKYDAYPYHVVS